MDFAIKPLNLVSLVLLIIGGLNWGLVGLFQFDLVGALFGGAGSGFSRLIYILVGASAVWQIISFYRTVSPSDGVTEGSR
jgi:uncharacterized membrane protein YuzA (DUF378 family)